MFEFSSKKLYLINYLLGAFILIASLLLIRNVVSTSLSSKKTRPAVSAEKSSGQQPLNRKILMHYSAILEKNPFGSPMTLHAIEVSEEAGPQSVPLSNLTLTGTIVGPGNMNFAIFEDKTQSPVKQEIFRLGAEVFNYGTLKKVERTSVEIAQNSVTQTVVMQDVPGAVVQPQAQNAKPAQQSFAQQIGEKDYILDGRRVQQSLEHPDKILTDARMLPNIRDGKQAGFKISEIVPGGIYHSLGLKNGDILLKINGLEISNPEVAMQAMSALKGMNNVNLDIIRNDQNMSMNYRIR